MAAAAILYFRLTSLWIAFSNTARWYGAMFKT
jgi:hypothetical protein